MSSDVERAVTVLALRKAELAVRAMGQPDGSAARYFTQGCVHGLGEALEILGTLSTSKKETGDGV